MLDNCSDFRGRAFVPSVEGDDQVMEAMARFDEGLPLIQNAPPSPLAVEASNDLLVTPPAATISDVQLPPPAASPTIFNTRRSARISKSEDPSCLSMLEKAKLRKRMKLEGKKAVRGPDLLLPEVELLEIAGEGSHLSRAMTHCAGKVLLPEVDVRPELSDGLNSENALRIQRISLAQLDFRGKFC